MISLLLRPTPKRYKVFFAKTPGSRLGTTSTNKTGSNLPWHSLWYSIITPVYIPFLFMMFTLMFYIINNQFKVIYIVVSLVSINMMYNFIMFKWSAYSYLHNISMMKNSLAIYVYPHITTFCHLWASFFKVIPSRRDIFGTTVSIFSRIVLTTKTNTLGFISTVIGVTYIHNDIITSNVIKVKE